MKTQHQLNKSITEQEFLGMIAKDLISQITSSEGLEKWSTLHGGPKADPTRAAKSYARALYGDSSEAALFNTLLAMEIERATQKN